MKPTAESALNVKNAIVKKSVDSYIQQQNRYNLHPAAVHNGLPHIDTGRTIIDRFCPAYLKRPKCTVKRYREYNGMCNNLDHPHWGATLAPYRRLLPPDYADGILFYS